MGDKTYTRVAEKHGAPARLFKPTITAMVGEDGLDDEEKLDDAFLELKADPEYRSAFTGRPVVTRRDLKSVKERVEFISKFGAEAFIGLPLE